MDLLVMSIASKPDDGAPTSLTTNYYLLSRHLPLPSRCPFKSSFTTKRNDRLGPVQASSIHDQATLAACWQFIPPLPERLPNIITIVLQPSPSVEHALAIHLDPLYLDLWTKALRVRGPKGLLILSKMKSVIH